MVNSAHLDSASLHPGLPVVMHTSWVRDIDISHA